MLTVLQIFKKKYMLCAKWKIYVYSLLFSYSMPCFLLLHIFSKNIFHPKILSMQENLHLESLTESHKDSRISSNIYCQKNTCFNKHVNK